MLPLMAGDVVTVPTDLVVTGDIVNATIVPADFSKPGRDSFAICGDADTVTAGNTFYYGPNFTLPTDSATTVAGMRCNIDAAGNATVGNVDEAIYENKAFSVLSFTCRNEQDANALVLFQLIVDEAVVVPAATCFIADNKRECVSDVQTTTDIAADAKVAMSAFSSSSVGANNGFICTVEVAF